MKTKKEVTEQVKLAKALGVSRQLISYHAKKKHAPSINDTEAWREFLLAEGRDAGLPKHLREELAKQRLRLLTEQADKLEMENAVKRREVINFESVKQFIRDINQNCFFGELDRLANEFPSALKGQNEIEIHKECLAQIERIKTVLRAKLDAMEKMK